ncbi:hypothetical protein IGI04_033478 [Brassica rapa subsp. trilocularis]|uniref:Katanin p80 subunit C-terminal domain-containing protein n=1 Tax=Brassica rapa subsp. trilocularis TaxID=1813537 RepID=A0ABQ7L610_BRACM|nr:hypothetical protein IGI04_033478 [Brassica rapa subsp. trilocularis]
MADNAVTADVLVIITERNEILTLDTCTSLLPILTGLIEIDMDQHLSVSLDLLLKLVRMYGSPIYSTLSAPASVGVDIQAKQRESQSMPSLSIKADVSKQAHWVVSTIEADVAEHNGQTIGALVVKVWAVRTCKLLEGSTTLKGWVKGTFASAFYDLVVQIMKVNWTLNFFGLKQQVSR